LDEFKTDPRLRQTLNDQSISKRSMCNVNITIQLICYSFFLFTAAPTVMQDSLQILYTSPSMSSFRIQMQLGHLSNDTPIFYPKSTVISETLIDGNCCFSCLNNFNVMLLLESVYQEKEVSPQSPEISDAECDGKTFIITKVQFVYIFY
jgi:hypothetical protein